MSNSEPLNSNQSSQDNNLSSSNHSNDLELSNTNLSDNNQSSSTSNQSDQSSSTSNQSDQSSSTSNQSDQSSSTSNQSDQSSTTFNKSDQSSSTSNQSDQSSTTFNKSDQSSSTSNQSDQSSTTFNKSDQSSLLNERITTSNYVITNSQGIDNNGSIITETTFVSKDPDHTIEINQDLVQNVEIYDHEINSQNNDLLNQIKLCAVEINCDKFHEKGTIEDYRELFIAASNIATETKQMQLDIDVDGFNEFANAADELSNLFNSFIVRLQNVNIINDTLFLQSILNALKKIVNLSNTFGRFKETILATSVIKIPKSAHDAKIVIENIMKEINCAIDCINYFVDPTISKPDDVDLTSDDKDIIHAATTTINNWNSLCEHGVSIELSNNPDIIFINQTNLNLHNKTNILKNASNMLKTKLDTFKFLN